MIDSPEPRLLSRAVAPDEPETPVRLPVPAGLGRLLVLAAVFVCAACGLVYELELVALASYLFGDSVTQASVVLSVMVSAMGAGSLLAKRLRCRAAVAFGLVEAVLALVGGCSAIALYASFVWFGGSHAVLVGFSLVIGVLIGAEVPLLMTLIQRVRRQDAGGAVADLFAADYIGALAGGLAFPFLLLPLLGQLSGALLTGAVNALAGGALVLWLFGRDLTTRGRWVLITANGAVLAVLAAGTFLVPSFERAARQAVYGEDVRVAIRTDYQEVVLTGGPDGAGGGAPLSLFLDGRLRFSGRDACRYHEALVHPAMAGPRARVLVLGGGDGLALREVLRYPDVRSVTVLAPDPGLLRLGRSDPGLSRLNGRSLADPRVTTVTGDVFGRLRTGTAAAGPYDVIVSDLPDPGITASAKLYSQEFYGLAERALAPGGRLAVHAGAPDTHPRSYWTVDASLRAAGLRTSPYAVGGRRSAYAAGPDRSAAAEHPPRTWGFVLAAREPERPRLAPDAPVPLTLTPGTLRSAERTAEKLRVPGARASTLTHPRH
ncbi:polyamine aminopropyltransferase [Streptomyces sp. S07_1.15]|uniref:polyamine aminopropyltransferase n=1 Tax=Streptomyces sp. S07_1.15 TaxID=2873925 RepID=UPI001D1443F1|nr:polyamine aminopropyltransferase [Streptomyces sp. S07_1.15]MCC3652996.1 polyamine aminopropyltransferase [Streptomyces sp. S07_1.15]